QPARNTHRRHAARSRRELHGDLLWSLMGARCLVRAPAADAGVPARRALGTIDVGPAMSSAIRSGTFVLACAAVAAIVFASARGAGNDYVFFAGYTVLQFVVLATAWNILGGYTGYVNFGTAAFFALGAYSTVFFHKFYPMPVPVLLIVGAVVSGLVGLGIGYLTLRLRGAFFAIATLALAVVLQTLVVNWNYVGGARGAYVIRPAQVEGLSLPYIQYLFLIMLALSALAIATARIVERSKLGYGFAAI